MQREIKKLIIYIPAYNESANIESVINELPHKLDHVESIQHLVIDDGSTDNTAELARKANAIVYSHDKNRGVGAAFQSAVRLALELKADILVSVDADRQFNIHEIPQLIQPILDGQADMVLGNRFSNQKRPANMPPIKFWGNKQMANLISLITKTRYSDVSCGYRAYNTEALLNLNLFANFTYTQETVLDLVHKGLRVTEVPVSVIYYPQRKSRVANNIFKYMVNTLSIIGQTLVNYAPMKFFGFIATFCFLISVICFTFLLGFYILNHSFTPYKFVGFIGLGFSIFAIIIMMFSLIANLLNRNRQTQERILYQVKKKNFYPET